MPLSAFGLNSAPVVSKVPGRDDNPGTNSRAFDTPLTWQVLQLTPAFRATSPRMSGELKARSPRLTRYDLRPPTTSEWKRSLGWSSASSFNSVPAGRTDWSPVTGNDPASPNGRTRHADSDAPHRSRRIHMS